MTKEEKLVALTLSFLCAEDATKVKKEKFSACGKTFSRGTTTVVCSVSANPNNWLSLCAMCRARKSTTLLSTEVGRRAKLDARNKALKALRTFWKKEYCE